VGWPKLEDESIELGGSDGYDRKRSDRNNNQEESDDNAKLVNLSVEKSAEPCAIFLFVIIIQQIDYFNLLIANNNNILIYNF